MKVLLNVRRDFEHDEWIECEGFKLVEKEDGSLDLIVTTDLARMREADKRAEELLERVRHSSHGPDASDDVVADAASHRKEERA